MLRTACQDRAYESETRALNRIFEQRSVDDCRESRSPPILLSRNSGFRFEDAPRVPPVCNGIRHQAEDAYRRQAIQCFQSKRAIDGVRIASRKKRNVETQKPEDREV